jgi:hypothetical protein
MNCMEAERVKGQEFEGMGASHLAVNCMEIERVTEIGIACDENESNVPECNVRERKFFRSAR